MRSTLRRVATALAFALPIVFPVLLFAGLAAAQETAATVELGRGLWEGFARPFLDALLTGLIAFVLGWLAWLLKTKWGIEIEAKHRDALQTALANAAGLVTQRLGATVARATVDIDSPTIREGVRYVLTAAPDAARKFGLGPKDIAEKILAKLPQVGPPPAAGR